MCRLEEESLHFPRWGGARQLSHRIQQYYATCLGRGAGTSFIVGVLSAIEPNCEPCIQWKLFQARECGRTPSTPSSGTYVPNWSSLKNFREAECHFLHWNLARTLGLQTLEILQKVPRGFCGDRRREEFQFYVLSAKLPPPVVLSPPARCWGVGTKHPVTHCHRFLHLRLLWRWMEASLLCSDAAQTLQNLWYLMWYRPRWRLIVFELHSPWQEGVVSLFRRKLGR